MIPKGKRRPESDLWAEFHAKLPGVLGALLDAVSAGLKNLPTTELDSLPRMADFATWVTACEEGLGWEPGTFAGAYEANRCDANQRALESSPLALAVWRLMYKRREWVGTSTQLLEELKRVATKEERESSAFPRAANTLSAEMNRIAPALREGVGIEYTDQAREGKEGRRVKKLTWITDPEKDRQHRQNRQPDEKYPQNGGFLFGGADDPSLSADDTPPPPSSANGRKEAPANTQVSFVSDDADGSDDGLQRPYKPEDTLLNGTSTNGSRLTAAQVLKEINRPESVAAKNARLYRRGGLSEEKAIEYITCAVLDHRGESLEGWERHAPVVEAALTHPLGCECLECSV
jgi:hypothetical protein